MKKHIFIFLAFSSFLLACNQTNTEENIKGKPLVKVYDKVFYDSDLKEIINDDATAEDSVLKAQYYIDLWVKKQLMIQKAELNLSMKQKNVERQLEEYRISLLTHKYKQKYLNEKMDTAITEEQLHDYYTVHTPDFVLPYNVVKAIYIKVPKTSPEASKIRKTYRTNDSTQIAALRKLCLEHADKFDEFSGRWVSFTQLISLLPANIDYPEQFLKTNSYIEKQDDNFYYLIQIHNYILRGQTTPFELSRSRIKSTILNKRREDIIRNLERAVYNDAIQNNKVEYFK